MPGSCRRARAERAGIGKAIFAGELSPRRPTGALHNHNNGHDAPRGLMKSAAQSLRRRHSKPAPLHFVDPACAQSGPQQEQLRTSVGRGVAPRGRTGIPGGPIQFRNPNGWRWQVLAARPGPAVGGSRSGFGTTHLGSCAARSEVQSGDKVLPACGMSAGNPLPCQILPTKC